MKAIKKFVKTVLIICLILATLKLGYSGLFGGMCIDMLNFIPYPFLR